MAGLAEQFRRDGAAENSYQGFSGSESEGSV